MKSGCSEHAAVAGDGLEFGKVSDSIVGKLREGATGDRPKVTNAWLRDSVESEKPVHGCYEVVEYRDKSSRGTW